MKPRTKGCRIMTRKEQETLKKSLMDINNLAKAFLMAKNFLAAEYGEAFDNLSDAEQSLATGKVLADILGI